MIIMSYENISLHIDKYHSYFIDSEATFPNVISVLGFIKS